MHCPCSSAPCSYCCSQEESRDMENEKCQSLLLGQTVLLQGKVQCLLSTIQDLDQPWECQALARDDVEKSPLSHPAASTRGSLSPGSGQLGALPLAEMADRCKLSAAVCAQKKWCQRLIRNLCPCELTIFSQQIKAGLRRYYNRNFKRGQLPVWHQISSQIFRRAQHAV